MRAESEKTDVRIEEKEPMATCVLIAIHLSSSLHAGVKQSKITHGWIAWYARAELYAN